MAKPGTFQKGHDPRRNTKGRPKSFNALRELAQQIGHEDVMRGDEPMVVNGKKVSVTEAILRAWAASKNPRLQQAFMEIAYGKTPAAVEVSGKDGQAVQVEHRGKVHGSVEHVAAVWETLVEVGAIQLGDDGPAGDAEDDAVHHRDADA